MSDSDSYCDACKREDYDHCTSVSDEPCPRCGVPARNTCPVYESGQHHHHDGCAGWPFCGCRASHTGPCLVAAAAADQAQANGWGPVGICKVTLPK